jgi:hypothetical protein
MIDLFTNTNPWEKRKVTSTDYCDIFALKTKDYYTYNDFIYHLSEKQGL